MSLFHIVHNGLQGCCGLIPKFQQASSFLRNWPTAWDTTSLGMWYPPPWALSCNCTAGSPAGWAGTPCWMWASPHHSHCVCRSPDLPCACACRFPTAQLSLTAARLSLFYNILLMLRQLLHTILLNHFNTHHRNLRLSDLESNFWYSQSFHYCLLRIHF